MSQSILDPVGPGAAAIEQLWWVLFWVLTVVFVLVVAALAYASLRRRRAAGYEPALNPDDRVPMRAVLIAGAAVPLLILIGLFVYTLGVLGELRADEPAELVVDVTGLDWWWRVEYQVGDSLVETANEIHIPVGVEVELRLRSEDVIHSFWVPQLAGKLDMIPGRLNVLRVRADEPGVFRGQCAEYCGVQHTNMGVLVVAQPRAEFEEWLRRQAMPAAPVTAAVDAAADGAAPVVATVPPDTTMPTDTTRSPGATPGRGAPPEAGASPAGAVGVDLGGPERRRLVERGRRVFLSTACRACHAVRGTIASSRYGPDLTHVASRRTIGALLLRNTEGNMAGWIANPQQLKPGIHMPSVPLEPEDLRAVAAYMMSLR